MHDAWEKRLVGFYKFNEGLEFLAEIHFVARTCVA